MRRTVRVALLPADHTKRTPLEDANYLLRAMHQIRTRYPRSRGLAAISTNGWSPIRNDVSLFRFASLFLERSVLRIRRSRVASVSGRRGTCFARGTHSAAEALARRAQSRGDGMNGTARTTIAPGSCTNGLPRRRPAGAVAALDAARGLRCSIGLMDDRRPRGGVRVRWVDAAYLGAWAFMACGGRGWAPGWGRRRAGV